MSDRPHASENLKARDMLEFLQSDILYTLHYMSGTQWYTISGTNMPKLVQQGDEFVRAGSSAVFITFVKRAE